jgi:murein L,D-transpeptidase YcbB/YkuD
MINALLLSALLAVQAAPIPMGEAAPIANVTVPSPSAPALTRDQVRTLRAALDLAPSHGLPADFVPGRLDALLASADPLQRRQGELLLLAAVADYARAVRGGLVPLAGFPPEWAQRPAAFAAEEELSRALAQDRLGPWLASLPPPTPAYAQLQVLLARYREIVAGGGWTQVPGGLALKPGADDGRVAALRERLAAEGYVVPQSSDARRFDADLAAALARFQARHGISPNGELDRRTILELNVSAQDRLAQIVANLERRRWAPRTTPPTRLEVNVAAQTLEVFQDGALVLSSRVVVGRPADKTPIFSDQVEAVVFNPPWNVPSTIATTEILPKARRDPGYLARNRFVVQDGSGPVSQRLQQLPGPGSALGLFKFDLPNGFNVYLHDTPAKALFARDERAFSHGCIRVEKPRELADLLLAGSPAGRPEAVQAALDAGATGRVALARPVPVSIAYWTVFVDAEGQANFRRDLYGWDAKTLAAMGGGVL